MRIKLKTEWVEWREEDNAHRLRGACDFSAIVHESEGRYTAEVFPCADYDESKCVWVYSYVGCVVVYNLSSLDEAKTECLRILIERDLLNPLDLLLESVCESG